MLYHVFCTRKNVRIGWIAFEAETPEKAAELARSRGWEVEQVKRASAESDAGDHFALKARVPADRSPPDGRPRAGRGVLRTLVGCLAVSVVAVFVVAILIVVNLPSLKDAPPLRELVRAPATKPISRCGEPIGWYVGEVDPRFDVQHWQVRRAVERAVAVWHEAWGEKTLFVYDEAGAMPIHLRYDENLHLLHSRHAEYEQRLAEYNRDVTAYNQQTARHDREVEQWNRRDGRGREAEYNRLDGERARLARERDRLRREERDIERMRPRGVVQGHAFAHYSEQIQYEPVTGALLRILDRRITVHYFKDLDHLAFIVAHELGHALLGDEEHLDDPTALMHATPEFPEDRQVRLSAADLAALRAVCGEPRGRGR